MCRYSLLVQGMCFCLRYTLLVEKKLYRELEIGGIRVILSAIHPFLINSLCHVLKRGAEVMFSVRDTPLMASFHVSWRHFGSGYVFLSAIHSFGGKNLYRELEIAGIRVILSAIHPFCRNTLCREHGVGDFW